MPCPDAWIADDSRSTRRLLTHHLETLGASVRSFENGAELLAAVTSDPSLPGLMILDMEMPGLDGCQTARGLRRTEYPGLLVLLSGTITKTLQKRAARSGFDVVLEKPINLDDLRQLIQHGQGAVTDAEDRD